ncbi:glycosyltransferase [Clostridium perfringens]|uniref:Glycoside hydrolase family protein n=2 Tax=Clostridium perfringens TaxID=1502 RepID=A0A2X2YC56_CLOPF|nr:glycosyltransferase [Clostridium perfringens]ALG47658.1 glycosyl transferase, group 1 family protein [Clostridium perfringens]AXH51370.1 glycosyltransferase family 1 protein [Clostridium perfringens]EDS79282.1 glycosyl transferase, group 1 family protein [Clostridium perfringens C str. JGS1495]EHK2404984.1 glycosyltransferase [Clostridium perfringens]EJT5935223.1 glycosyltransferase [Clostridium perfringens]
MSNIFEVMLKKNIGDFTYEEKRELNNWLIENLKLKELIYSGLELTKVINEDGEETAYYENKITEEDILSGNFNELCSKTSKYIDDAISSILFEGQFNCFYEKIKSILELEDFDEIIVFHASFGWNIEMKQRPQHLAEALSKKKVLYIYRSDVKNDNIYSIKKIKDNLYVLNLDMYSLNMAFFEAIKSINKPKFLHVYATCLNSVDYEKIKTYMDKGFKVIYDFVDELSSEISGYNITSKMIEDHEKLLRDKENVLVVSTAKKLKDIANKFRGENENNILAPNAVNLEDFKNHGHEIGEKIQPIVNKRKPIIGYYGALAKWFDYKLIEQLAKEREDYEIVLIGMDYDGSYDQSNLKYYSNISYLGMIDYKDLINYSRYFDVCIVPFIKNDITDSTSPLKIFEYMALEKPIVTTNINECKNYESCLISKDYDEFIRNIDKALKLEVDNKEYFNILRREAEENTWDNRAELIKEAIKNLE